MCAKRSVAADQCVVSKFAKMTIKTHRRTPAGSRSLRSEPADARDESIIIVTKRGIRVSSHQAAQEERGEGARGREASGVRRVALTIVSTLRSPSGVSRTSSPSARPARVDGGSVSMEAESSRRP